VRFAAPAVLLLVLVALVAGCGGGGSTTVVEKTVTVESQGGGEAAGGEPAGTGGGETSSAGGDEGGTAEGELGQQEGGKEATGGEEAAGGATSGGGHAGQPEDKIEEPTRVVHLQSFRSPSGNIGCVMFEGGARCDIKDRDWSPPARPASCPEEVDFGQGLAVSHDGKASFVCAGDTALDPTGKALDYGEVSEVGGTQCISRSEGITCANHAGHGFFISIQSYKIF
jgi:hypothetical protein